MVCLAFSCTSSKDVVYFQDASQFETLVDDNTFTSKFKVDDLVSIHVSTLDPEASAPFNLFRGAEEGIAGSMRPEQVNYLVDVKYFLIVDYMEGQQKLDLPIYLELI